MLIIGEAGLESGRSTVQLDQSDPRVHYILIQARSACIGAAGPLLFSRKRHLVYIKGARVRFFWTCRVALLGYVENKNDVEAPV